MTYPLQLTQTILRIQENINIYDDDYDKNESSGSESIGTTTTPKRFAEKSSSSSSPYQGTLDCLISLYRKNGLQGWFAGMRAKLLQTVMTAAFTFLTYEQILRSV